MNAEELTQAEAIELADDLGQQLYRAEDRIAFVREMLDRHAGPLDPQRVLAWLDHQHCPRAESEQQQIARLTAQIDRVAAECDRIEGAVRAQPTAPDFDGAYLAAIRHIRTALNGPGQCAAGCGQPLTQWQRSQDERAWHPDCVPPGTPMMGARPARADERPVHTVDPGGLL